MNNILYLECYACLLYTSKKELADIIDKTVITTGHFSLKKNILASLAVIFKEATTEKFKQYTKQVVLNAKALQKDVYKRQISC